MILYFNETTTHWFSVSIIRPVFFLSKKHFLNEFSGNSVFMANIGIFVVSEMEPIIKAKKLLEKFPPTTMCTFESWHEIHAPSGFDFYKTLIKLQIDFAEKLLLKNLQS